MTIRTLIVDDDASSRTSLVNLLGDCGDIRIVGMSATGRDALQLIRQHRPDVAVLDLHLPDISGLDVARQTIIFSPETRFVAISAYSDVEPFLYQPGSNVLAFVHKSELRLSLVRTVCDTAQGIPTRASAATITQRERRVVGFMSDGLTNQEIAHKLGVTLSVTEFLVGQVLLKLRADSRAEAIRVWNDRSS